MTGYCRTVIQGVLVFLLLSQLFCYLTIPHLIPSPYTTRVVLVISLIVTWFSIVVLSALRKTKKYMVRGEMFDLFCILF
ncbi:hypothetical protein BDR07DRAFT_1423894 [Suillus spraguei]|nr:hypothetical protein BDR07DRAFT_1443442 [Suillus spraguei]KAG2356242.1 hypothetical protein BDR07DRAFT_1423894 [Suillus spraguei]